MERASRHWFPPNLCWFASLTLSQLTGRHHYSKCVENLPSMYEQLSGNYENLHLKSGLTVRARFGWAIDKPSESLFSKEGSWEVSSHGFKITCPPTVKKPHPQQHHRRTPGLVPFIHQTSTSGLFCGSGWTPPSRHPIPVTGVAVLDFAAVTPAASLSGCPLKQERFILHESVASPIALWSNSMFSALKEKHYWNDIILNFPLVRVIHLSVLTSQQL